MRKVARMKAVKKLPIKRIKTTIFALNEPNKKLVSAVREPDQHKKRDQIEHNEPPNLK